MLLHKSSKAVFFRSRVTCFRTYRRLWRITQRPLCCSYHAWRCPARLDKCDRLVAYQVYINPRVTNKKRLDQQKQPDFWYPSPQRRPDKFLSRNLARAWRITSQPIALGLTSHTKARDRYKTCETWTSLSQHRT